MNVQDFTSQDAVVDAVKRAKAAITNKEISDIIDEAGHQYVDLVMEGGSVFGIALVGYTYVLEQAGIRFLGVGGTSAGAINALLVTALGKPGEEKSTRLLRLLANLPLSDFADGDHDARELTKKLYQDRGRLELIVGLLAIIDNIKNDKGLHPGRTFHQWLKDSLHEAGINTQDDLSDRLSQYPDGLKIRGGAPLPKEDKRFRLSIVAADITTETKAIFPQMGCLYWKNPGQVNPADYARASASIPFFFHPFRVKDCPGNTVKNLWKKLAGYGYGAEKIPEEVLFVDGGIMSNFPIDLFHTQGVPRAPTFGVKLGPERIFQETSSVKDFVAAVFNTARHTHDYDFIRRNFDYRLLVSWIDIGNHGWLDFNLSQKARLDLFAKGAATAAAFLQGFDWAEYKTLR